MRNLITLDDVKEQIGDSLENFYIRYYKNVGDIEKVDRL